MNARFALALLLLLGTSTARAEVANTELLGDQANLMGGAVTASTQGGPSMWYNPARLSFGSGETATFAVSGVGFAYRYYSAPHLVTTGDGSASARASELIVLPRATTLVMRAREKLYWGLGLFTPARQDVTFQTGSSAASAEGQAFTAVASRMRRNSLHAVGSVSWNASERWQLGASLGYVTYSYFHSIQTSSAQYDPDTSTAMALVTDASQRSNLGYGTRLTLGVSVRLATGLYLGASLAPPTWLFFANVQETSSQSAGAAGELMFKGASQRRRGGSWDSPEPGAARVGLCYTWASVLLELDGEVSGGASSKDFNVEAPAAGNMRAGAVIGLKNKLRLGLGFYTDLEQREKALTELGDSRLRGLGGTLGVNFVSRLPGSVPKSGDKKGSYAITLAGRYAYFEGDVLGLQVAEPGQASGLTLVPTRLRVNEVALQLGLNGAW